MIKEIARLLLRDSLYFRLRWYLKHGLRYRALYCYWGIDGWLSEREAIALYELTRSLKNKNPIVVEIGSWLGKSSVILGKGLRRKAGAVLYCIDPFDATGDDFSIQAYNQRRRQMHASLKDAFVGNITRCGVADRVRVLTGTSGDFVKGWQEPIDLLFIDGDHSYAGVRDDFLAWSPHVLPGGFIAFHDVISEKGDTPHELDGPYRIVREHLVASGAWIHQKFTDHLFTAQKK